MIDGIANGRPVIRVYCDQCRKAVYYYVDRMPAGKAFCCLDCCIVYYRQLNNG